MSLWQMALTRVEVLLALVGLAGAAKSAYNGTIRGLVDNIRQIPEVADRVDRMADKQEQMVDGMVALSVAESDEETTIDTDQLANDLRDGQSYRVYLNRDSPRNPYAETEDEEQLGPEVPEESRRWRSSDDD